MAYNVILTDGSRNIVIPIGQISDSILSIPLVGREHSGYGQAIATAQIHMLENFASETPPPNPLVGQLWYDKGGNVLRVYDDATTPDWVPVPSQLRDLIDVDSGLSPAENEVFTYVGGQWTSIAPVTGVTTFTGLTDTLSPLLANGFLRVNAAGNSVGYTATIPSSVITGTLALARIPDLPTSKITSGVFPTSRIPNLPASQITSGTFNLARIPNLPASQITSGSFPIGRIPNLPASQITSGTFPNSRISASSVLQHAVTLTGGTGINTIGALNQNRTISVDSSVIRTTGGQTIGGNLTVTGTFNAGSYANLPASATRGEISLANLTNSSSSVQGFITGRRFAAALTNALQNPSFGDIGTYVFGVTTAYTGPSGVAGTPDNGLIEGTIVPGSFINPSGGHNNNSPGTPDVTNPTHNMVRGSATLPGQWRVMGRSNRAAGNSNRWRQTLFLRVS